MVCRNGEEIDTLASDVNCYQDKFHGAASYTVYAVDIEGHKSPLGIPADCLAGSADREAPVIVINSPLTSIMEGTPLHIRFQSLKIGYRNLYPGYFTIGEQERKCGKKYHLSTGPEVSSH